MRVYILRHKYINVSFIRLFRRGRRENQVGFRTHLFMSLSNLLVRKHYSEGKYGVIHDFLEQHDLFNDGKEAGAWLEDWDYKLVLEPKSDDELIESTEAILLQALEGDAFLLNSSLPWNRGTILRDVDGRWKGIVRPDARKERYYAMRRSGRYERTSTLTISSKELALKYSERPKIATPTVQKHLNPFLRVLGG